MVDLQLHIDFISGIIGFDMHKQAKKKSRQITQAYQLENNLVKVFSLMNRQEPGLALYLLGDCYEFLVDLTRQDKNFLVTRTDEFIQVMSNFKLIGEEVTKWKSGGYQTHLDQYKSYNIFTEGQLTPEKIDPQIFLDLDDSFQKKLIRPYRYAGTGKVNLPTDFKIKDHIVMVNSLEDFFTTLPVKNEVMIYYILKIEEQIAYSYFLIVITYQEHVWLVSDMQEFDNPQNKATRRNPDRVRKGAFENLCFPYYLLDDIEAKREGKTTAVKKLSKRDIEFLQKPLSDIHEICKVFMLYVTNHYLKDINSIKEPISLLGQQVDQLLLEDSRLTLNPTDKHDGFEGWEDHIMEVHNELINEVMRIEGKDTALVKVSKEVITKNKLFDRDWLASPTKLKNIIDWTVLDNNRESMQKILAKKFGDYDERKSYNLELSKKLNAPEVLERLIPILFSGEEIMYAMPGYKRKHDFGFSVEKSELVEDFKFLREPRMSSGNIHLWFNHDTEKRYKEWRNSWELRRKYSHDQYVWDGECEICKKHMAKRLFIVHIRHYSQLVFLLGGKDNSCLPDYYRIYRAHDHVPYHGNSILDNIHPMAELEHPSWRHHPNGLDISAHMCKVCYNKLKKQHQIAPKTIIIDGKVEAFIEESPQHKIYKTRIN